MKDPIFYQDSQTGAIIEQICCREGEEGCCGWQKLIPNTGVNEKHLPIAAQNGCTVSVKVGSVSHPMEAQHSIQWVVLQSEKGCQRKELCPDREPVTEFALTPDDRPLAVFAYCNLHGLWKTEL